MKQEHKFCAEVYHRLYGQIDHSKRVLFCLDGQAAAKSVDAATRRASMGAGQPNSCVGAFKMKDDVLECVTVPDMCFFFTGANIETRIEAKILEDDRSVTVQAVQREKWKLDGGGKLPPQLWIIADEPLKEFWLLEHSVVAAVLMQKEGANTRINLWPNAGPPTGLGSLDDLTARIVAWAKKHKPT